MRTTINFDVIKASADYSCTCPECGKTLRRKANVEHTVNPFNKNEAGEVKTRAEVRQSAQAEANAEAAKLEGSEAICRDCEDAPNRALLLSMAASPDESVAAPERFWNSPFHHLLERKHIDYAHVKCACGSDCCSGYKKDPGFKITKKGMERAAKLGAESPEQFAWRPIKTAPQHGDWFRARTASGYERTVHYADKHDRLPICNRGEVWSTIPVEWRPLTEGELAELQSEMTAA